MRKTTLSIASVPIALALASGCPPPVRTVAPSLVGSQSTPRANPSATTAQGCQISAATRSVLAGITRPIHATLYLTQEQPIPDYDRAGDLAAYTATVRAVKEVLDSLTEGSDGRFGYESIVVDSKAPPQEAVDVLRATFTHAMGIVLKSDDLKALEPVDWLVADSVPGGAGLEFRLAKAIRNLSMRVEGHSARVGVLTGHGEPRLSDPNVAIGVDASLSTVLAKMHKPVDNIPNYDFRDVDLQRGDLPIDPQLEGLLILQPELSLTEKELHRIDDFVLSGKKLVVASSAVNIKPRDRTMQATLDTHGLGPLLLGYGFEMREDVVLDRLEHANVEPRRCDYNPMLIQPNCPSERLPGVAHSACGFAAFFLGSPEISLASSLVLRAEKQPEEAANLRAVIATSANGQRRTGTPLLNPLQQWKTGGSEEQIVVAATISGRLRSAFTSVGAPSRVPEGRTASVLVVSSASLFANPYVRVLGQSKGALTPQLSRPAVMSGMSLECAADRFTSEWPDAFHLFQTTLDWISMTPEFANLSEQTWCNETLPTEFGKSSGRLVDQTDGGK